MGFDWRKAEIGVFILETAASPQNKENIRQLVLLEWNIPGLPRCNCF